ncbi:MAG: hypothetical protein JWO90_1962 [Solirubrobacterales bacterium]|jgi:hypothetical protein|nr:hypothetical protein [Solirubrobacterales bacterium]
MLNPVTPAEVVVAIGHAARDGARSEDPGATFARGQLLSAYSATRHLATELSLFGPEVAAFAAEVARIAREGAGDDAAPLLALAAVIAATEDAQRLGDPVCELLDLLRADGSPQAALVRAQVRAALARLGDREVELLADAIEGPAL